MSALSKMKFHKHLQQFLGGTPDLARIGIVDDDDAVRDAIGLLLRVNGFDVTSYNSGPGLLADDRLERFGCLILDAHMPAMTGVEVLELLRRRAVLVPVIIITGRDDPALINRALQGGAVSIMQKPISEQSLMSRVESALARGNMRHP